MAKKRKKATEAQIRALNGGDEAYERHERVQRRLQEIIARLDRKIEESRRAWETEQAKKAS
jgi:hypothetical protein